MKTTKAAHPRKVFIVDDHPMTRYGIAQLLKQEPGLEVCGEAGSAEEALGSIKPAKPDLVLADITMPGKNGLEFIKDLQAAHPDLPILVISMHEEEVYAERVLRAGARGYLMKHAGGHKLLTAINQILEGKIYVSENMAARVLDSFGGRRSHSGDTLLGKLTDREFEVFQLIGQGLTTREIGERLNMSGKTVETHRLHIREKLSLKTAPELMKYAVRWGGAHVA
jgi:DNA-binding NarL/FixJ family response regulator